MIKMKFPEANSIVPVMCTPQKLSEDKDNEYPTGLYILSDEYSHGETDSILYFGYGVWVRNQACCNLASYTIRYVGPVELTVKVTGGDR